MLDVKILPVSQLAAYVPTPKNTEKERIPSLITRFELKLLVYFSSPFKVSQLTDFQETLYEEHAHAP